MLNIYVLEDATLSDWHTTHQNKDIACTVQIMFQIDKISSETLVADMVTMVYVNNCKFRNRLSANRTNKYIICRIHNITLFMSNTISTVEQTLCKTNLSSDQNLPSTHYLTNLKY